MGCCCNCGTSQIIIVDPGNTCEDCLRIYSFRILCSSGPVPDPENEEGTLVLDLSLQNDISACGESEATYSIFSFDADFWDSVSVTSEGVLTAVSSTEFETQEYSEIVYKVTCNEGQLSAYGSVFVCKEDLCASVSCDEGEICNPATGICEAIG